MACSELSDFRFTGKGSYPELFLIGNAILGFGSLKNLFQETITYKLVTPSTIKCVSLYKLVMCIPL